jgi:quercetin dioxygenase-like cupin family protein
MFMHGDDQMAVSSPQQGGGTRVKKLPQAVPTVQVDNERVRVTEWRFAPGAETGVHIHQLDYTVVPLSDGRLQIVSPQGEEQFAELKLGACYFRKAGVHHNVINASTFEFAFIEVELKNAGPSP